MRKAILAVLIGCFMLASSVVSAETTRFSFRGKTATAGWWQWEGPCIITVTQAIVSDDKYREDHKGKEADVKSMTSRLSLSATRYNVCEYKQETILQGEATLEPDAFQTTDLKSASLWAIIPVYDAQGKVVLCTLDLQWSGTEIVYTGRSNSFFAGPGFVTRNHYNGRTRVANVQGTIIADGEDFTRGIVSWGDIGNLVNGYVDSGMK